LLVNLLTEIAGYNWQVSLSGHLFDQFLINEALDIIEAAGGSFHLVNCHVGQSAKAVSFSELEVSSPVFLTEIFTYVSLKMFFLFISMYNSKKLNNSISFLQDLLNMVTNTCNDGMSFSVRVNVMMISQQEGYQILSNSL